MTSKLERSIVPIGPEHDLKRDMPQTPSLMFTTPREGWPPRAADEQSIRLIVSDRSTESSGDRPPLRAAEWLLHNARVRALVGERFVHLGTHVVAVKQRTSEDAIRQLRTSFYSYSNIGTVDVVTAGEDIVGITTEKGAQPPECATEVRDAIDLALRQNELAEACAGLDAHGILLPLQDRRAAARFRLIWVTFTDLPSPDEELPTKFVAVVDLISRRVVMARKEIPFRKGSGRAQSAE